MLHKKKVVVWGLATRKIIHRNDTLANEVYRLNCSVVKWVTRICIYHHTCLFCFFAYNTYVAIIESKVGGKPKVFKKAAHVSSINKWSTATCRLDVATSVGLNRYKLEAWNSNSWWMGKDTILVTISRNSLRTITTWRCLNKKPALPKNLQDTASTRKDYDSWWLQHGYY